MKVSVEQLDGCRRQLDIAVEPETTAEDYDGLVAMYAQHVKVSGFRQGRAPRDLVEKRYGKRIVEDAKERLVPRFYRDAIEQEKINAVSVIEVDDVEFSKASGLAFKVTVDIAPEFKLPKYKKLTLKREAVDVSDEQVTEAIDGIRERFSRFEDVTDRQVQRGDLAQIDYAGRIDSNPISEFSGDREELGEGTDFWVPVDDPEFLPGLNDELVGMGVGETKTIKVAFPDDYQEDGLQGKTADYDVTLKGIRGRALPELDEAFLKRLDVETEADLRKRVREDLESAGKAREQARRRDEVSKMLLGKAKFEVPESVLQREQQGIIREMVQEMIQSGTTGEDLEKQREELFNTAADRARDRVRLAYIISRIGDVEGIEINDEDLNQRLTGIAQRYNMSLEQFRAELDKREGSIDAIRSELHSERVLDAILEQAKIKG